MCGLSKAAGPVGANVVSGAAATRVYLVPLPIAARALVQGLEARRADFPVCAGGGGSGGDGGGNGGTCPRRD